MPDMNVADQQEFGITPIERRYQQALNQMTGTKRVLKTAELYSAGWRMIARQVEEIHGTLSERELRYRVALRMYEGDIQTLKLIEKAHARSNR
jgi:hypothetical protein